VNRWAASGAFGVALLLFAGTSSAESALPVQLRWQAPAGCPQEGQVRQKLRDLLGGNAADAAASRLRAEGQIEPVGERFRLTLNIHYDLVNGTRVVLGSSCEDLGGVAAVTLALLFRAEHSSSAPLTARDLGGGSAAVGGDARNSGPDNRASGSEDAATDTSNRKTESENRAADNGALPAASAANADEKFELDEQHRASESHSDASRLRFLLRAPELRADIGVLPEPSYGLGLAAGLQYEAWRFLLSGALWLGQDYEPGPFVGYGAHFGRFSGELSACRSWGFTGFELAPCLQLTLDDVAARGTGVGIASTNPRTAWLSVGAGLQGLWALNSRASLIFGVNGRIATSRPRFVSEGIGEISQVGPAALGVVLGCEWRL